MRMKLSLLGELAIKIGRIRNYSNRKLLTTVTKKLNNQSSKALADGQVVLSLSGSIAKITLNRPDKKNAISHLMWREIVHAFEQIDQAEDIRCVLLTGGGGSDFSAGADIGEFDSARHDPHTAERYEQSNSDAFRAVRDCPVPVLAVIRGVCFGGAFGLAAAADLRIASRSASFSVPAGKLGLSYPADAMADIVEAVGPQFARYMLYSARRINAETALDAGFVLSLYDDQELDESAMRLAADICANAPLSNRASKAAIRAALSLSTDDCQKACDLGASTFSSRDYEEGRLAFREKRKPVFRGN